MTTTRDLFRAIGVADPEAEFAALRTLYERTLEKDQTEHQSDAADWQAGLWFRGASGRAHHRERILP
jgi:hypothetical protein